MSSFKRILVAYDGKEDSKRALIAAVNLSAAIKSELFCISAEDGPIVPDSVPGYGTTESEAPSESVIRTDQELHSLALEAQSLAAGSGITLTPIVAMGEDEVSSTLDAIDSYGCDLLVLGLQNKSGILAELFPKPAAALVSRAPCSVLVVH